MPPSTHRTEERPSAVAREPGDAVANAYVGVGSNLGDRLATLRAAVRELDERGTKVVATSAVFECKALVLADADPQPEFLNAVIVLATELAAAELLERLLAIERAHGRVRAPGERWTARSLDLDLLAYVPSGATQSVELDEPTLVLPHPRAGERDFVLAPLAEVAPTLVLAGHTVADRLASLPIGARTVLRRLPDALR